jgi:hypothetical protein
MGIRIGPRIARINISSRGVRASSGVGWLGVSGQIAGGKPRRRSPASPSYGQPVAPYRGPIWPVVVLASLLAAGMFACLGSVVFEVLTGR